MAQSNRPDTKRTGRRAGDIKEGEYVLAAARRPACQPIAEAGITTSKEFAAFMSALLSDIICGRINHREANAACNAAGKMLKIIEMQIRYGEPCSTDQHKVLQLVG